MKLLAANVTGAESGAATPLKRLIGYKDPQYGGGQYWTGIATGTFDTATAKIQYSADGTDWADITDLTFTDNGAAAVALSRDGYVRYDVSSVGAGTDVSIWIAN